MKIPTQTLSILYMLAGLLFLPVKTLPAPGDKADSLKQAILAEPRESSTVDNLLLLTQLYIDNFQLDTASAYAEKTLDLATEIKYRPGIAESHYKFYIIARVKSDYQEAVRQILIYTAMSEELNDEAKLGKAYYAYGLQLAIQGKKDSAVYYIRMSQEINEKIDDPMRLIATSNGLGNIYLDLAMNDSAAFYFLKAAKLAEERGFPKYLGSIYNNLGETFTRMKDYKKAEPYLLKALEINKNNNNTQATVETLTKLGNNEVLSDNIPKGLTYFDEANELLKTLDNKILKADLNNDYAFAYELLGKKDLALDYYKLALADYRKQDYVEGMSMSMKNIGQIYKDKGNHSQARLYLDSAYEIASKAGYLENQRLILWALQDNCRKAGQYEKALDYYDQYYILKDSTFKMDKIKVVNELEKKYEKEKDQARILTLEKENLKKTIQKNATLYSALGLLMIAAFVVIYFRQKARKDRIIAQHKIRQLEEEKKLMSAKLLLEGQEEERKRIAQELHDGLGVLLSATKLQFTSIKDLSPENRPIIERATQLLDQATGDVRRVSHNMMPGLLTKMGFYDAAEELIENIGESQEIEASFSMEGDSERLSENKEIMLYRIVQELVNNTIRHANAKNLALEIRRSGHLLEITYSDDGIGFDPLIFTQASVRSIGLKSIKTRIEFLEGQVRLESSPGQGVKYFIRIPV